MPTIFMVLVQVSQGRSMFIFNCVVHINSTNVVCLNMLYG